MIPAKHRQPEESVSLPRDWYEKLREEIVPQHNGVIPVPVAGRRQQEKIAVAADVHTSRCRNCMYPDVADHMPAPDARCPIATN